MGVLIKRAPSQFNNPETFVAILAMVGSRSLYCESQEWRLVLHVICVGPDTCGDTPLRVRVRLRVLKTAPKDVIESARAAHEKKLSTR